MFKLYFKSILLFLFFAPVAIISEVSLGLIGSIPVTVILLAIFNDRFCKWSADYDRDNEDRYPF